MKDTTKNTTSKVEHRAEETGDRVKESARHMKEEVKLTATQLKY